MAGRPAQLTTQVCLLRARQLHPLPSCSRCLAPACRSGLLTHTWASCAVKCRHCLPWLAICHTSAIHQHQCIQTLHAFVKPTDLGRGQSQSTCDALQKVQFEGASEAEVAAAKGETLNSFVFNFASTAAQLLQTIGCNLLGLPQVRHITVLANLKFWPMLSQCWESPDILASACNLHEPPCSTGA